jgi:hypothetical protein
MRKETVVVYFKVFVQTLSRGTEENHEYTSITVIALRAKIGTLELTNTKQGW